MVSKQPNDDDPQLLEEGDIHFLYRPRVQKHEPDAPADLQRFYLVLKPQGQRRYRLMILGGKHLPDVPAHERVWDFVDRVRDSPKDLEKELQEHGYETQTRGQRELPAVRPAGESHYAMVQTDGQMHLVYALELLEDSGEVQKDLKIAREASFALSIKEPEKGQPKTAGLRPEEKAEYPQDKQAVFRDRRFECEDPELPDYEGTEFVLVGARANPEEGYGLDLEPEREDARTADIIKDLRMAQSRHPVEPLFQGQWS